VLVWSEFVWFGLVGWLFMGFGGFVDFLFERRSMNINTLKLKLSDRFDDETHIFHFNFSYLKLYPRYHILL